VVAVWNAAASTAIDDEHRPTEPRVGHDLDRMVGELLRRELVEQDLERPHHTGGAEHARPDHHDPFLDVQHHREHREDDAHRHTEDPHQRPEVDADEPEEPDHDPVPEVAADQRDRHEPEQVRQQREEHPEEERGDPAERRRQESVAEQRLHALGADREPEEESPDRQDDPEQPRAEERDDRAQEQQERGGNDRGERPIGAHRSSDRGR